MGKIYDISLTLTENLPVWPGSERALFEKASEIKEGDMANVTNIKMCAHTGTHVDAPLHFVEGAGAVETMPLEAMVGPAQVIDVGEVATVTADTLNGRVDEGVERLLIKSINSKQWVQGATEFITDYVAISADGAQYLVDHGVKLIGVDYLSVAPFEALVPTHDVLLKAGVVVVEGLDLSKIEAGYYALYCLPLKIKGADGAPARAILIES